MLNYSYNTSFLIYVQLLGTASTLQWDYGNDNLVAV
jgi:hypothetical protein